jgi:hypothetical protein
VKGFKFHPGAIEWTLVGAAPEELNVPMGRKSLSALAKSSVSTTASAAQAAAIAAACTK